MLGITTYNWPIRRGVGEPYLDDASPKGQREFPGKCTAGAGAEPANIKGEERSQKKGTVDRWVWVDKANKYPGQLLLLFFFF